MKRVSVTPDQLATLQHKMGVDILLPLSQFTNAEKTNETNHTFHLIYSVDFYYTARPQHLLVSGYVGGWPLIDVKWSGGASAAPKIEVLVDSSVEIPKS